MRRRFQKGSLQQVRSGKAKRWVVLYYNTEGKRRFHTLGAGNMTKSQAEQARDEFMRTINGCDNPETGGMRPLLLSEFIDQTYLPFQRGKWKKSTQGTSENRIQHHIVKGIGRNPLRDFSLTSLQGFLDGKAEDGLSFSVVDHLRWDLNAMFEMAVAEKLIDANPATRLYTPKHAPRGVTRAMSIERGAGSAGSGGTAGAGAVAPSDLLWFPARRDARSSAEACFRRWLRPFLCSNVCTAATSTIRRQSRPSGRWQSRL